jgi:uncharacterized protein YuzE
MEKYRFNYDSEDDVFYIQNAMKEIEEGVEFSEDIVLDLDKKGNVVGVEIFYASEFFSLFNQEINREFLRNLKEAHLEYRDFRNVWFVVLVLKTENKVVSQPLPPLKKSEYVSPLIASY